MIVKELLSEEIYECVFEEQKIVVLVFYTNQFEPCKGLLQQIKNLSVDLQNKIKVYTVDYNTQKELVMTFEIVTLPTIILLKDGQEKYRFTGTVSNQQLEIFISMLD